MANLADLGISNDTSEINGTEYVVTTSTDDRSYASDLGGRGL